MQDKLANLLMILAFVSLAGALVAVFLPMIAFTRSRAKAAAIYLGACLVLLGAGGALITDFSAGATALRLGDFDDAVERLSAVPPGDERYDSAQVLLRRAREGKVASEALKAKQQASAAAAMKAEEDARAAEADERIDTEYFGEGASALAEGYLVEAYDRLSKVPAGHEKYDTAQVLLRKAAAEQKRLCPLCPEIAMMTKTYLADQRGASGARRMEPGCYKPASGNIHPGVALYYGEYRQFAGTVVVSTGKHVFDDGSRERALQVQYSDGGTGWMKRNVIVDNREDWFVEC